MSDARDTAETNSSIENYIALQHVSAKLNKTGKEARTKSWIKKTAGLDTEKDDTKLWRLTRQLNDEGTSQSKIILLQGESMIYGKQAADILARTYKEASDITVLPYQQAEVRREQRNIKIPDLIDSTISISIEELNYEKSEIKEIARTGWNHY